MVILGVGLVELALEGGAFGLASGGRFQGAFVGGLEVEELGLQLVDFGLEGADLELFDGSSGGIAGFWWWWCSTSGGFGDS